MFFWVGIVTVPCDWKSVLCYSRSPNRTAQREAKVLRPCYGMVCKGCVNCTVRRRYNVHFRGSDVYRHFSLLVYIFVVLRIFFFHLRLALDLMAFSFQNIMRLWQIQNTLHLRTVDCNNFLLFSCLHLTLDCRPLGLRDCPVRCGKWFICRRNWFGVLEQSTTTDADEESQEERPVWEIKLVS